MKVKILTIVFLILSPLFLGMCLGLLLAGYENEVAVYIGIVAGTIYTAFTVLLLIVKIENENKKTNKKRGC